MSHIWRITQPGSSFEWVTERDAQDRKIVRRDAPVDQIPCVVVESTQKTGGQAHFYMETQACVAKPIDDDRMTVHPSSQSPMAMHQTVAMALSVEYNQLDIELEQAVAVISVYSADGSIIVHQGGVDVGQGVKTKCEQIASYILNVPMEMIFISGPRTSVTPNPTSTGGSVGTAYNGEAVKQACEQLRSRPMDFGYDVLKDKGNDWCTQHGIDFWNHPEGWAKEVAEGNGTLIWQNLVHLAYTKRVSLVAAFTAKIRGGTTPIPNATYKSESDQPEIPGVPLACVTSVGGEFDSFVGFTYSAACSVVELDVLTGEVKILSSDICYEGWSLNPALDIGQVEGAFVQGIGYVLTENLVFQQDGDEAGRLNTVNTWRTSRLQPRRSH